MFFFIQYKHRLNIKTTPLDSHISRELQKGVGKKKKKKTKFMYYIQPSYIPRESAQLKRRICFDYQTIFPTNALYSGKVTTINVLLLLLFFNICRFIVLRDSYNFLIRPRPLTVFKIFNKIISTVRSVRFSRQ